MEISNLHVALVNDLNDLASRYGLRPQDAIFDLFHNEHRRHPTLKNADMYEIRFEPRFFKAEGVENADEKSAQFKKLLAALGSPDGCLQGSLIELCDTVDAALKKAPRARPR